MPIFPSVTDGSVPLNALSAFSLRSDAGGSVRLKRLMRLKPPTVRFLRGAPSRSRVLSPLFYQDDQILLFSCSSMMLGSGCGKYVRGKRHKR